MRVFVSHKLPAEACDTFGADNIRYEIHQASANWFYVVQTFEAPADAYDLKSPMETNHIHHHAPLTTFDAAMALVSRLINAADNHHMDAEIISFLETEFAYQFAS